MKKVWIGTMALVIALITCLYIVRSAAPSPGEEIPQIEPSPAPVQSTEVTRPKRLPKFPEGFTPPEPLPRDLSYLPESKHDAVLRAEHDFGEEAKRRITSGKLDAAGFQELEKLHRDLDQRLSQVLTPEEKFEFDLRDSVLGQGLKSALLAMEPTDAEFRAIYRHRNEFEKRIAENPLSIDLAWKECDERVRTSIGEGRFEKYRIVHDADFRAVYHSDYASRLPLDVVYELYRIQAAAGEAADRIRIDSMLSNETKLKQLKELAAKWVRDMEEILGDGPRSERFKAHPETLTARMESLTPRSPRIKPESLVLKSGVYVFPGK